MQLKASANLASTPFNRETTSGNLSIEAVAHNTQELNCGRSLDKFPEVVSRLKGVLARFADALSCIDQCFIADDMLEQLPAASRVGKTIVGGIDLNKPRMRA